MVANEKNWKMLLSGGISQGSVVFENYKPNDQAAYDPAVDAYQIFLFLNGQVPAITVDALKNLLNNRGDVKEIQEIQERLKARQNPELYATIQQRKEAIAARKAKKQAKQDEARSASEGFAALFCSKCNSPLAECESKLCDNCKGAKPSSAKEVA